jgi:hypothetical protein
MSDQSRDGRSAADRPDPDWISEEIDLVADDLAAQIGLDANGNELNLTGLEPIIIGWATKFVIGFAAKFAGQAAYDKWKAAKKKREYAALREQLGLDETPKDASASLLDPELRHDLVESLVEEGLTVPQATKIVERAMTRIRDRLV